MKDALDDDTFNDECQVAIEYNIPQTSKRVDFMLLGSDNQKEDNIVIVELNSEKKLKRLMILEIIQF